MTSVQFEAALIIDVITRARKAAPKVSSNTERFAGIILDIQPAGGYAVIRATNEDVFYREVVECISAEGERAVWRLSSTYLSDMISKFRSRSGDTIDFIDAGGQVEMTQMRKRAKLGKMKAKDYPEWFDTSAPDAEIITDFGNAIKMVEWAGDPSEAALGVRVTSTAVYATDKYIMARYPIEFSSLPHPITLGIGTYAGLIPERGDIKAKLIGGQILFMPNDSTQIRGATIDAPFPPVERAMSEPFPEEFSVARDELNSLIATASSALDAKKASVMRLFVGDGQVAGFVEQIDDPATGIRDIIDVSGAEHAIFEVDVNPSFLGNAVSHCPDERITCAYTTKDAKILRISGSSGYQCWVRALKLPVKGTV